MSGITADAPIRDEDFYWTAPEGLLDPAELERARGLTEQQIRAEVEASKAACGRADRDKLRKILIADLARLWRRDDCETREQWVSQIFGISHYKAARYLNAAFALEELPLISGALEDGVLNLDKVLELCRFATPDDEAALIRWATRVSVRAIKDRGDELRRIDDDTAAEAERARTLRYEFSPDESLMYLNATLAAADGAALIAALDAVAQRLPADPEPVPDPQGARRADALVELVTGAGSTAASELATVVLHAPLETFTTGAANATVAPGVALHPETAARLVCDSRLQVVLEGRDGDPLGIGDRSRTIPRWMRRAVLYRDGHICAFPSCGSRRRLNCHHVTHWPLGPTEPANLVSLCPLHHRLVHERGWHVSLDDHQRALWYRPDWTPYLPDPPPAETCPSNSS